MKIPSVLLAMSFLSLVVILPAGSATKSEEEINHLIDYLAKSPCSFVRNGRSYSTTEAKAHLERKYAYVKDKIRTTEDFIELVASRSSTTGQPYLVRCAPRPDQPSSDWFRTELLRFRNQIQRP
jgi:hypothetical protein